MLYTVITFELSDDECNATEGPDTSVEIRVIRDQSVLLANPVTISINPVNITEAEEWRIYVSQKRILPNMTASK